MLRGDVVVDRGQDQQTLLGPAEAEADVEVLGRAKGSAWVGDDTDPEPVGAPIGPGTIDGDAGQSGDVDDRRLGGQGGRNGDREQGEERQCKPGESENGLEGVGQNEPECQALLQEYGVAAEPETADDFLLGL